MKMLDADPCGGLYLIFVSSLCATLFPGHHSRYCVRVTYM